MNFSMCTPCGRFDRPPHRPLVGASRRRGQHESSDADQYEQLADLGCRRKPLAREPAAVEGRALRSCLDHRTRGSCSRMCPRKKPTKCGPEKMLGQLWSNRIGKLACPGQPTYRHLVLGLPDEGQKSVRDIFGLIQKWSWIKPATGHIRAVGKARCVHHRGEHAADVDVPIRREFLPQARGEATQAELTCRVGRGERCRNPSPDRDIVDQNPSFLTTKDRQHSM